MAGDSGRQKTLERIAEAINEHGLDEFDATTVQAIATEIAAEPLTVDDGGGLHDPQGARIGAIRRAPSGEWIIDGQNVDADRSDAPIPATERRQDEPGEDDDEQR
jgi:hypothetical protein